MSSAYTRGDGAALLSWGEVSWREISYPELARRVEGAALSLVADGLAKGDRVALLGANSPEWGLAYLAIQRAGGVVVPLDRLQTVLEWQDTLRRSGAVGLFAAVGEGVRLLPVVSQSLPQLKVYGLHGGLAGAVASFDELALRPAHAALPDITLDDVASLIFTSGTTGKSKGVMLTHGNLLANAQGMLNRIEILSGRDRFLSVLPMSHCYECTCGFIAPLLAGASVYFARGIAPREIISDLERSRATFLLGVPLLYEKIVSGIDRGLRQAGWPGLLARLLWSVSKIGRPLWRHHFGSLTLRGVRVKAGLGHMRYLVSGGAPLPPSVGESLEALGVPILQGYGLTETSPVATLNPPTGANPASVGLPLTGVELKIRQPSESGDGEVLIRGDIVMRGYWEDEDSTRAAIRDGWFCTGDLGRLDSHGHLHITGRLKNLIVTQGGKNISPEEVEGAASKCPAVAEILVYGREVTTGSGEEVCARVYPDPEYLKAQGSSSASDLLALVRGQIEAATSHLASYKKIVHYEMVMEPFEKTTSHKIKRFKHSHPRQGSSVPSQK